MMYNKNIKSLDDHAVEKQCGHAVVSTQFDLMRETIEHRYDNLIQRVRVEGETKKKAALQMIDMEVLRHANHLDHEFQVRVHKLRQEAQEHRLEMDEVGHEMIQEWNEKFGMDCAKAMHNQMGNMHSEAERNMTSVGATLQPPQPLVFGAIPGLAGLTRPGNNLSDFTLMAKPIEWEQPKIGGPLPTPSA